MLTSAMGIQRNPHSLSPQMCNLAEKINWLLSIPVFKFSIRRTHATHRLYIASQTLCFFDNPCLPHIHDKVIPSLTKSPTAQVIGITA